MFVIKQGKLAVTIHKTTSVLETGDVFFVPQGELCDLYIQNYIRSASLSFERYSHPRFDFISEFENNISNQGAIREFDWPKSECMGVRGEGRTLHACVL